MTIKALYCTLSILLLSFSVSGQNLISVEKGWASNSVNTTVFRKNSLVTYKDTQFIAYYDPDGNLTLGKRKLNTRDWTIHKTQYKGNVSDAHNSISIMVDGDGYLHVSWDHHGHPLRYAKGIEPYSLLLSEKMSMTGENEGNVTYPEFFRLPDGNLIFMYRDGQSGRGNLVLNYYNTRSKEWEQIQRNLIDGEDQRNAYWQACVDTKGVIHLSWVWRETWDVSTNHDICYARSIDGGKTWQNSKEQEYHLPINASTAEYCLIIPQNSELINQTSMTTDEKGNPYIATYWRNQDSDIPQYHVVYSDGKQWYDLNLNFRTTPFSLKGGGTKRIPISRPQIVADKGRINLIFRDEERAEKVSVATCKNVKKDKWIIRDLTNFGVGSWEPSYDTELWREKGQLHIFVQKTTQIDGEGSTNAAPEPIQVLEVETKQLK
jgi:hypothetical protein